MNNKLSYQKKEIPITVIQGIVSEVSGIAIHNMLNKTRNHEICLARQISVVLCAKYRYYKKYHSKYLSDTEIMSRHNRERTTIYNTQKVINNFLDTNYLPAVFLYKESVKKIEKWMAKPIEKDRIKFLKKCINNHVPLEIRQEKLYKMKNDYL